MVLLRRHIKINILLTTMPPPSMEINVILFTVFYIMSCMFVSQLWAIPCIAHALLTNNSQLTHTKCFGGKKKSLAKKLFGGTKKHKSQLPTYGTFFCELITQKNTDSAAKAIVLCSTRRSLGSVTEREKGVEHRFVSSDHRLKTY